MTARPRPGQQQRSRGSRQNPTLPARSLPLRPAVDRRWPCAFWDCCADTCQQNGPNHLGLLCLPTKWPESPRIVVSANKMARITSDLPTKWPRITSDCCVSQQNGLNHRGLLYLPTKWPESPRIVVSSNKMARITSDCCVCAEAGRRAGEGRAGGGRPPQGQPRAASVAQ